MATVRFTPHLRRYFPLPDAVEVEAETLAAVVEGLEARWPGIAFYIADEHGRLRQHVAVWVDGRRLHGPEPMGTALAADATVHIMQALSGG